MHSTQRRRLFAAAVALLPLVAYGQFFIAGETARDIFGDSPEAELATAAAQGRSEDVRRLVSQGAKVNAAGKHNLTPLVWALTARNPEGMRALLESGADPNERAGERREFHPVWLAAGQEVPGMLAVLLEFNGDPNARHNGSDYVPLMRAKTNLENVRALVRAGADINVADSLGSPFVLDAASLGQYGIVIFALQNGFTRNLPLLAWEVHDRRPDGQAPLPPTLEPKRQQVIEMLRQMGVASPPEKAPPLQPN